MIGKSVSAQTASTAIGGDNQGNVINVATGGAVYIQNGLKGEATLSTCLGGVITVIAQQSLSQYGHAYQRDLSSEVQEKLNFNHIGFEDQLIQAYRKYYYVLENAYKGAEQANDDTRVLVRHRAGSIYRDELAKACAAANVLASNRVSYAREKSFELIGAVASQLKKEVLNSQAANLDPAWIDMAIDLVVVDAVAECNVLEKAPYVASP